MRQPLVSPCVCVTSRASDALFRTVPHDVDRRIRCRQSRAGKFGLPLANDHGLLALLLRYLDAMISAGVAAAAGSLRFAVIAIISAPTSKPEMTTC